ncbi:MAG: SDR family oxidoreductase [Gammaproteobacteria bacterium]|nr:SDR family oxidoreductase [Gammaproteobacteria bacterium]
MTTTVITGANRGIGLELTRQSAARGDDVIAVCRNAGSELESLGVRVESGIDVSVQEDVDDLAARLSDTSIDTLISNAGILSRQSLDNLDFDEIRRQFEVNSLGPLRVTAALRPQLKDGAKVAIVTSRMGSIADNTSGGHYGYRMSKCAVNMAGVSLARDLKDRDISVILLHPGYVDTDMTNHSGNVAPADAAAGLLQRIDELTLNSSGVFRHANGEDLPW